jgi:DNA-binding SARP family transcriptional activator
MLLHTLGELRLEESEFQRSKALLLLTYLALEGSRERQFLARLFWPGMDNALGNLAMTLARLKKAAPGVLETDNLYAKTTIQTDTQALDTAFNNKAWHEVLELYKGSFLQGVRSDDWNTELEEWVYEKREAFAAKAREALLHIAEQEASKSQFDVAAQHALKAYHLRDAPEPEPEDLERLYVLLRAGDNPHAKDVSKEAKGFGLDLHFSEEEARQRLTFSTSAKPHNLPFQHTEFIGRDIEKKQLAKKLYESTCRLLTIVGPGGMGKTRLAIACAEEQLEAFRDGVCFVSFAAVTAPDLMVYALADALELKLLGQRPPKEQVLHYLEDKTMLLVLDNLEHLLTGIDLMGEILSTASKIKILATSRERLSLQSEHLFDLYGLSVPDINGSDAHSSDALQLFAERAKHNRHDFELEQHLQAVTRICQLVGGLPLAIEVAASWSRLLSPEEIARELEQNLDILATSTRDLPQRHHSMRSVFEVSWQRLSEDEQAALRKLSVFVGGFDREAARAIAELDLPILLSLVNKSFLWRDSTGRFTQHPLILQYVQQKADDYLEDKKQSEEKHGLYYLEQFREKTPGLRTQTGKETLETLERELPNLRTAWDWMVREKRVDEISRNASVLSDFFLFAQHGHEGAERFKQAVNALDATNPKHQAALGYALIQQAWTESESYIGKAASQLEMTRRGLELLEPLRAYSGILQGKMTLSALARRQSEFTKAKEILTSALDLARTYGSPQDIPPIMVDLVLAERELGSFAEVTVSIESILEELRELGDTLSLSFVLTVFGAYLVYNDHLDEGEKLLLESLELSRQHTVYVVFTLADLARLAYKRCDFREAERLVKEAYEHASKQAYEHMEASTLAIWGRVKLAQGQLDEAERLMIEALKIAWDASAPLHISHALVLLAELNIAKGQVKQGVSLLSFLSRHQAIEKRDRDEAIKLLEKTEGQLSARAFSQAQKESKLLTLAQIVTEILEGDSSKV